MAYANFSFSSFCFFPFTSLLRDRTRAATARDENNHVEVGYGLNAPRSGFHWWLCDTCWVSSGCGWSSCFLSALCVPGRAVGARVAAASGLGTVPASWSLCSISGGTLRNTKMYQVGRKSWPPGARLGLVPVCFSSVQLEKGCIVGQSTGNLSGHCCSESLSSLRSLIGEFYTRIFSPTWQWQTVIK